MGRVLPVWQSWTTTAHRGRVYQPIRDVIHRIHRPDEPAGSFADPVSATAHVLNPAPVDVPTWAPDRAPARDTRIVGALNDAVGAERGVLDLHPCRRTDSGRAHLHLHHDGDRGAPSGRNNDDQVESRGNNDHPRWHSGSRSGPWNHRAKRNQSRQSSPRHNAHHLSYGLLRRLPPGGLHLSHHRDGRGIAGIHPCGETLRYEQGGRDTVVRHSPLRLLGFESSGRHHFRRLQHLNDPEGRNTLWIEIRHGQGQRRGIASSEQETKE